MKTERSYVASLANFEQFLVAQNKAGKTPILLVDEAQYMTRDALKLLHYLLNFETHTKKLLQVVLVGQEELGAKILRYRELASRMFPIAMNATSPDELRDMVSFRITVAGGTHPLFVPEEHEEAFRLLYAYTKGLPRDIIKICFELLVDLAIAGRRQARAGQVTGIATSQRLSL